MRHKELNPITWLEVNNIVPIIVTIIGTILSFTAWTTRVSILETKLDLVLQKQDELITKYSSVETRYGQLSIAVAELKTEYKQIVK